MRGARQLELRFRTHGGRRRGAGRKPNGAKAGVSHLARTRFARLLPVHVTVRMARHVWSLRSRRSFSVVGRAIGKAAERFGMRIVEFAVEGNHVHLVVEAETTAALSRGMQGLSIRLAKGLNRMMKREGRVLADRFHAHVLRTPTEARRAVAYVRNNHREHARQMGEVLPGAYVDSYASTAGAIVLPAPHTWLLRSRGHP